MFGTKMWVLQFLGFSISYCLFQHACEQFYLYTQTTLETTIKQKDQVRHQHQSINQSINHRPILVMSQSKLYHVFLLVNPSSGGHAASVLIHPQMSEICLTTQDPDFDDAIIHVSDIRWWHFSTRFCIRSKDQLVW